MMKFKKSYQDSGYWIAKVKKDGSLVAPQFGWAGYAPKKNAEEALVEMQQKYPKSKFVLVRMVFVPEKG
jgi:hypothetical protein